MQQQQQQQPRSVHWQRTFLHGFRNPRVKPINYILHMQLKRYFSALSDRIEIK